MADEKAVDYARQFSITVPNSIAEEVHKIARKEKRKLSHVVSELLISHLLSLPGRERWILASAGGPSEPSNAA